MAQVIDQQFVKLPNGVRLHYASSGQQGRPLMLFVHGFPEFWYAWREQLPEFGEDWFAVAPDLRGFNLSDQPAQTAAYRPRLIVDDLRLLIEALGYQQCVLVAHDWGGAIAWNLAIAMPQLLSRLVIINAPHPLRFAQALMHDAEQQKASAYMNWLRQPDAGRLLSEDNFRRMEGFFLGWGQRSAPWFNEVVRERYLQAWGRGLAGGLNYYRASPLHPPTADDAGPARIEWKPENFRVRVPTLVIWGESDVALPKSLADGLDELVDDLQLVRVPEGSHWIIHEQPARINALIRAFTSTAK